MIRAPLASISGNRRRGPELTPYQRGIINGAYRSGATPTYIAHNENTPLSTIKWTISTTSQHPNGVSKTRSGRPTVVTDRARRHIIRLARTNPRITYKDLRDQCGVSYSKSTLYRELKAYGLTNWLSKKRPLLTEEVAAKRLTWCKEREHWTYENWCKVIWSDECSVERGTGKERGWVFRFPDEKWTKQMIQPYKKGKGVSVMVWGAFYSRGEQSGLLRLGRDPDAKKNRYTAASYVGVLDEELPTLFEPGLLFIQDNAPIHISRLVKEWFEENGIDVLEWPPYSPDLNPIEHLWFRLKKLIYSVYPDIEQVGSSAETVRKVLYEALERA